MVGCSGVFGYEWMWVLVRLSSWVRVLISSIVWLVI